jgi:membrane-bound lytic murein transglycosylase A
MAAHRNYYKLLILFLAVSLLPAGCAVLLERPVQRMTAPLTLIEENGAPVLLDDLDLPSLEAAIERSLQYYRRFPAGMHRFGNRRVSADEMRESLLLFREIIRQSDPPEIRAKKIRESFEFYQAAGTDERGSMLITGYYVPLLNGSPVMTEKHRYPIYSVPDDLIVANLGRNGKNGNGRMIGRMAEGEAIPYYSRREIDEMGVLRGRGLEIAWVDDPVALFQLHVQGSGRIRMTDGRIIGVSFAQSNGRPFRSISRFLQESGRLNGNGASYQNIKAYLKEHPDEQSEIFGYNERYIFFHQVRNGPIGSLQVPVTPGRSIATDPEYFPKGALAFMKAKKPHLSPEGKVLAWVPFSRFVLSQDAGIAIRGTGRVDLFCGDAPEMEQMAGSLKEKGALYFLVKKR